jgi:HD-GYP domain-containing protein (c-di-GMP phosphodiesterase class II)
MTGAQQAIPEKGTEAYVRALGRSFVTAFYGAMRSIRLYPAENPVVQKALQDVASIASELLGDEGELELRVVGEFLFVNKTRLRLDLDNYATVNYLISQFRTSGTGMLRMASVAAAAEWLTFLSCLNDPKGDDAVARHHHLQHRLSAAGISAFELEPPVQAEQRGPAGSGSASDPAKSAYAKSVAAASEVMHAVAIGQSPNLKVIKRTVQLIVDRILTDEASMLGLTTVRDYEDHTFTHAVNVCIFSVALGRRLGLSRVQLYDLGLAALFHDCGKSRIPADILEKRGKLTQDDWRLITGHSWMGVLTLFRLREHNEVPYRAMMVAYEHHLRRDEGGYPKRLRPRPVGFFSKIVGVIEVFDAATTDLGYDTPAKAPAAYVAEMRENAHNFLDPVVVLTFTDMLGPYPVGTVVVLDNFQLAIAHSMNPNPDFASRPMVLIISDDDGNLHHPGELTDLGEMNANGTFKCTIADIIDADKYGIRVGDYFL